MNRRPAIVAADTARRAAADPVAQLQRCDVELGVLAPRRLRIERLPALAGEEGVLGGDEGSPAVEGVEAPPPEPRALARRRTRLTRPRRPEHGVARPQRLDRALGTVGHQDQGAGDEAGGILGAAPPAGPAGRRGPEVEPERRRVCSASRLAPQSRRRRFLCVGAIMCSPEPTEWRLRARQRATHRAAYPDVAKNNSMALDRHCCDLIGVYRAGRGTSADGHAGWNGQVMEGSEPWSQQAAWQALLALRPRLRRFASGLTGSLDEADDLVQAVYERAVERHLQWEPGTRFHSWVFKIAHSMWISRKRHAAVRGGRCASPSTRTRWSAATASATSQARLALSDVRRLVAALPADQRAALMLVAVDGLSYADAAEVLAVPPGTVASRVARARLALALAMDGKEAAAQPPRPALARMGHDEKDRAGHAGGLSGRGAEAGRRRGGRGGTWRPMRNCGTSSSGCGGSMAPCRPPSIRSWTAPLPALALTGRPAAPAPRPSSPGAPPPGWPGPPASAD